MYSRNFLKNRETLSFNSPIIYLKLLKKVIKTPTIFEPRAKQNIDFLEMLMVISSKVCHQFWDYLDKGSFLTSCDSSR
jgi:hypothetical protein